MDAVLPLIPRDLERLELLFRSFEGRVTGLKTLWIVVPDSALGALDAALSKRGPNGCEVRVVSELELLPTLRHFPATHGWYRQMLIKFEAANHVESEFYLTLDADVLATRPLDLNALCAGGKAPCHVDAADLHPKWYRAAAALLGEALPRQRISHQVTPAILHVKSVQALLQRLGTRWERGSYSAGVRGIKQRFGKARVGFNRFFKRGAAHAVPLAPWCAYLCCSRPWAEYALYYSFLELTGLFEQHFRERTEGLYAVNDSVWFGEAFKSWNPTPLFVGSGPPYFAVIQSNAEVSISELRQRLHTLLDVGSQSDSRQS